MTSKLASAITHGVFPSRIHKLPIALLNLILLIDAYNLAKQTNGKMLQIDQWISNSIYYN